MNNLVEQNQRTKDLRNSSDKKVYVRKKAELRFEDKPYVKAPKDAMIKIYEHWVDVGADKHHISRNKHENELTLNHWYKELVIENEYFPTHFDIGIVLGKFFRSLTHGSTTLNGFSLRSYLESFRMFWRSNGHLIAEELAPKVEPPKQLQERKEPVTDIGTQLRAMYGDNVPEPLQKYLTHNQ